jgi:hypothetical protein
MASVFSILGDFYMQTVRRGCCDSYRQGLQVS